MTKTSKRLVSPLLAFQALVVTSYYYTENVILSQIFKIVNMESETAIYNTIARDRPSPYGTGNRYLQRDREGQALALRKRKPFFTTRSRGTGPRATAAGTPNAP